MRIRRGIRILTAFLLYGFSVFCCRSVKETASLTYLLLTQPIDAVRAEEIFAQESALPDSVGFCFWGETESVVISCDQTGGVAEVKQMLICGNPELLGAGALAWQDGCFLDHETAQALFGTNDCRAQRIVLQNREYRVFGTLSAVLPSLLRVAEPTDGAVLSRCVLSEPAENGKASASQFIIRWGLQGSTIDFYALWAATCNILLILPTFLLLRLMLLAIRKSKHTVFPERIKYLLLLLCCIWLLTGLSRRIIILPDMIPNQWSDFSFWGRWWENQWTNLQMVMRTPMSEDHLQMILNMVKSIGSSMTALLLMWTFRRHKDENTAG